MTWGVGVGSGTGVVESIRAAEREYTPGFDLNPSLESALHIVMTKGTYIRHKIKMDEKMGGVGRQKSVLVYQ